MMEAINMDDMSTTKRSIIKTLQEEIEKSLRFPADRQVQRVTTQQQRVISDTQNIVISRLTNDPQIMQSWNPMAKGTLKSTPRIHQRTTRNNNPGQLPLITKRQNDIINEAHGIRQSQ